ncbi:hypothetical protein [Arthrobacter sp. CJ23]|uniref:hypothetical protein n=1 Tax=Arthrobacter sp. CJ23 TaxID=2972479 RepID=UPI00215CFA38|nr:hypothetical protein [Arthrobacter sp. CJ23]UVJ39820.1 hypothetical protein NVV90_01070 [Arthrobacter sp. CJ23]
MTSILLKRPAGYRHIPSSKWTELSSGDAVWIYEAGWGVGAGRVDVVSTDHELLWVLLEPTGRRLLCGTDAVEVWSA